MRWTKEDIAYLEANWDGKPSAVLIAMGLGRTRGAVISKAEFLGITFPQPKPEKISGPSDRALAFQPPESEWFRIASEQAVEAGVRPSLVMSADQKRCHCLPRWRAWYELYRSSPNYSIAGVARVAGAHHVSLLNGFKRLRELGEI